MRKNSKNMIQDVQPIYKAVKNINLDSTKIKNCEGSFEQSSQIPQNFSQHKQTRITKKCLPSYFKPITKKIEYEKEEIVFDKSINKWKIVKESELYKYKS